MQRVPLNRLLTGASEDDCFVFFDTSRTGTRDKKSYLFRNPSKIISCLNPSGIKRSMDKVETLVKKGYFAAGFLSYEAGFALEDALNRKQPDGFPLLWFGLFKRPETFNHPGAVFNDDKSGNNYRVKGLKADISKREYVSSIHRIKDSIRKGDTYQINYTFRLNFSFSGSITDLYLSLRRKQSVPYSALIKLGGRYILSFSPELFFRRDGALMQVKPMKGTISRGRLPKEDAGNAKSLRLCPKNRSENIMIVDLLRNDLSRISRKGTVKTKSFFDIEKYESLFQMTSTVESKLRKGVPLYGIFKALFPSGSVTGAPKISSMKIIDKLEKSPRRVYTGGIGFLAPSEKAVFNVAIRTLSIDTGKEKAEMGIGSGIVYDSDAGQEYDECILKAKFLTGKDKDFSLIETILWEPGRGYRLLKFHMIRLSESAGYFDFRYDKKRVMKTLKRLAQSFNGKDSCRVRLLLERAGGVSASNSPLKKNSRRGLIAISSKTVDSRDPFLFHKTTNRRLYDTEHKLYKDKGFFDVIFRNERGEVTEGAISNIFIKKKNTYYTPPLECGLLNGVYRRYLISDKRLRIKEKILYADDIKTADRIILTNAVRGMVTVSLKRP